MTSQQRTLLCSSCIAIFDASINIDYVHHQNGVAGVIEAIGAGCVLCAKFWSSLTYQQQAAARIYHQIQPPEDHFTHYILQEKANSERTYIMYGWPTRELSQDSTSNTATIVWKRFKIIPAKPLPSVIDPFSCTAQNSLDYIGVEPRDLTGMPSSNGTWSSAEVQLAQGWIKACAKDHGKCRRTRTTFMPSRLIEVGTTKDPIIKLCEGRIVAPEAEYTTLSHCWGTTACYMLKKTNFEDMKILISHNVLPKTIGDAILITRSLQIQYIWVDSLCIIQDSVDDWATECEKMGSIYAGSYCNIAATAASINEEGCIFDRDPASILPVKIQQLSRFPFQSCAILTDEDVWALDVQKGPLLQRAWVVQERLLAPRNLHSGRRQLSFECNERLACETYPAGFPENLVGTKSLKQQCSTRSKFKKRGELSPWAIDRMRMTWAMFVAEFSEGKLSRAQDKLAAVRGVAAQMGVAIGSPYVAGLWLDQLPEQLLWRVEALLEDLRHFSTPYQAPSWSWAAVNHPVREAFADGLFRYNAQFFITFMGVEAENPGMVIYQDAACIRLRGK